MFKAYSSFRIYHTNEPFTLTTNEIYAALGTVHRVNMVAPRCKKKVGVSLARRAIKTAHQYPFHAGGDFTYFLPPATALGPPAVLGYARAVSY